MPELTRFFGIIITLFTDHDPPHIHVSHGDRHGKFCRVDWVVRIEITTGKVLDGNIPSRDLKLVRKWLQLHRDEVLAAWEVVKRGGKPGKIAPLRVK